MSLVLHCRDCQRPSKVCACTSHAQVRVRVEMEKGSRFLEDDDPVARFMAAFPARRDRMVAAAHMMQYPIIWFIRVDETQFLSPREADLEPFIRTHGVVAHIIRETLAAPPGSCAVLMDDRAFHDQMVFSLFHAPIESVPPALVAHFRETFAEGIQMVEDARKKKA